MPSAHRAISANRKNTNITMIRISKQTNKQHYIFIMFDTKGLNVPFWMDLALAADDDDEEQRWVHR